jgi:Carboxypeptidase regulatory-like domain
VYLRGRLGLGVNDSANAVTIGCFGDDMKRISIVAILMFALAACGSPSSVVTSGSPSVSPSISTSVGPSGSPSVSPSVSTSDGAYSTVSGQIVRHDTGEPYPNAYVRFGWLVNASYEKETHTVTDDSGRYEIQLPAGQYEVTAGDSCDLNAGFAIVGRAPDNVMITVPGTSEVDFVEYPITPGADLPGVC